MISTSGASGGVGRRRGAASPNRTQQVHQGASVGALAYDFPEGEADNFVVFQCAKPLAGTPEYLSVWVYGDGAGNLLNAWVQDATGLRWQFGFGPVDFTGWQRMTAHLVPGQAWPNGPLDGSDADTVAYPVRFDGFALDNPGSDAAEGVIYLDDLRASSQADSESGTESGAAAAGKRAAQPTPTPTPETLAPTTRGSWRYVRPAMAPNRPRTRRLTSRSIPLRSRRASARPCAGPCATSASTLSTARVRPATRAEQEVCPEATTTYTLRVKTLADEQEDYTVEVEVTGEVTVEPPGEGTGEVAVVPGTGEPLDQITVDDAEVLAEPLDLKGVNDKPGIEAVAIADCAEARKLKCADMDQYQSNPSFGKSTKACLVWVEQGAPFGSIDIAVRREAPNPANGALDAAAVVRWATSPASACPSRSAAKDRMRLCSRPGA